MHLSYTLNRLEARQGGPPAGPPGSGPNYGPPSNINSSSSSTTNITFVVVSIVVVFFLFLLITIYLYFRRRSIGQKPAYLPPKSRWWAWKPRSKYGQVSSQGNRQSRSRNASISDPAYNPRGNDGEEMTNTTTAAGAGVDRNTSVRSVMTLPAYSQAPKESEQVIGREGERAGMDTVVEFPETGEEEEARRDEEMESLFQIRQARRQEIADRERRRQERHEARMNGDWTRLQELTQESRARTEANRLGISGANGSATNLSAAALLAEHQSRGRDRRVSSVTYASLGHVRHDGTRLRADSMESERGGLLDGAAPMGEHNGRGGGSSGTSSMVFGLPPPHFRNRSTSSVLSISTTASDLESHSPARPTPPSTRDGAGSNRGGRSRNGSDPAASGTSNSSPTAVRFTPEHSTDSDELGDSNGQQPPTYEQLEWGDAPAYQSPVADRGHTAVSALEEQPTTNNTRAEGVPTGVPSQAPRLPTLEMLPSISVESATEPNTPVMPHIS